MSKHLPPIPPQNRSPKGTGGNDHLDTAQTKNAGTQGDRNFDQQGQQGNSKQNTTTQGLQQDR